MLKVSFWGNILLIFLFWFASILSITPAYNHFVQYADQGVTLPLPTLVVLKHRMLSFIIPAAWSTFLFFIHLKFKKKRTSLPDRQLLSLTVLTLCIGLGMLVIFIFSGMLPFLKIGSPIH